MTARDDAANIAADALTSRLARRGRRIHPEMATIDADAILDALAARPDVLAAWAIETGALERVSWSTTGTPLFKVREP